MKKINERIFHEYDIRGIYPDDFNEKIAYQIGKTFADYSQAKKILVGYDTRISSPAIFKSLSKGLIEQGVNVFNAGIVPIDFMYALVPKMKYQAGLMITASHNPPQYNGLKMIIRQNNEIEVVSGKLIGHLIGRKIRKPKNKGKVKKVNHWQEYLNHLFSFVDLKKIKPLKIVVDTGNGVGGKVIPLIAQKIPCQIISRFFELDGRFPNRPPNPLVPGVLENLGQEVIKQKADFGVAFDGDADRIFLVDEKGQPLFGDQLILLLAKKILKENPGVGIVYTLNLSRAVPEFITKMGGKPIRSRIGYRFVSENMKKNNGFLGGEQSGHFSFRKNFYTDSGFIAFLTFLEIISESNQKLSQLTKKYKIYFKAPEINIQTPDIPEKLSLVKEKYQDGKIDELDGLTIEYQNWWFNLRPSNTEPVVRLTIEAKTKKILEEKRKKLLKLLK